MQNDFRNYAVNHLGLNSNTLDSYARYINRETPNVSATMPSADYMNPYILEERQLNVTQMDVFSRLMMGNRIIFLGTQVSDTSANIIQAQLLYLDSIDPRKISRFISTLPAAQYMQVLAFTTQCSISRVMCLRYARVWQLQWRQCFSWPARMASVMLFLIQG